MRDVRASSRLLFSVIAAIACASGAGAGAQTPPEQSWIDRLSGATSDAARDAVLDDLIRTTDNPIPAVRAILTSDRADWRVPLAVRLWRDPEAMRPAYVDPLIRMLFSAEEAERTASARALSIEPGCLDRLVAIADQAQNPVAARRAATRALGWIGTRSAAEQLVRGVGSGSDGALVATRLEALQAFTHRRLTTVEHVERWWQDAGGLSEAAWQRRQVARAARETRALRDRHQTTIRRLVATLRENYLRIPESERFQALQGFVTDTLPEVRLLGLELIQILVGEGQTIEAALGSAMHELLRDADSRVRAAAVRAMVTTRNPTNADRFRQMLANEGNAPVRLALINALGYIGDESAVAPLLALVGSDDAEAAEAVSALGRLIERDVARVDSRERIGQALVAWIDRHPESTNGIYERVLIALGALRSPDSFERLVAALQSPSAGAQLAAIRGLAVFGDPRAVDAVASVVDSPDVGVRRAAIELLAQQGQRDAHLDALWRHAFAGVEPEETIRRPAWEGALRLLKTRPIDVVLARLDQLPAPEDTNGRAITLLRTAEAVLAGRELTVAEQRARGELRTRLARRLARTGSAEDAIATYRAALADFHAAAPENVSETGAQLVVLAIESGRYNDELVDALRAGNPPLDANVVWNKIALRFEELRARQETEAARRLLEAFRGRPPVALPADVASKTDALLAALPAPKPPTSQPAATTQPVSPTDVVEQPAARGAAGPTNDEREPEAVD